MYNNTLRLLMMILLTPAVGAANYAPSQLPMPQHYVEDYANVVQPNHEHALNGLFQELEKKTGVQYIILTVPTTGGISIDKYSLELANNNWKLGQQGKDNGMLFVIAVSDRKYWFTPGLGLEGFLTDSYLGNLGQQTLVPRLKQGQYSEGIHAVNLEVVRRIANQMGVTLSGLAGVPQATPNRGTSQRPIQPVRRQHVGGHDTGQRIGLPCCVALFLLLPILLLIGGGLGIGRRCGTGGMFFPMMFYGFGGHNYYHPHHGPFGGGPFGGGFGGFGGGMGYRSGGHTGGGFGHFGGGGGGHFSGHGAGGSW